jgi:hypothetical protein
MQLECKKDLVRQYKDKPEYSTPPTYTISKEIDAIVSEIAALIGHLLKGLGIFLGRKAKAEGTPKAIQFSHWLKNRKIK